MRNGSGTMTPSVDFTTEAASPPIEIAKLDTVLDDIAAEITNSIAADGQTNPSADLKMNGFKHTNVGAATALTHYGRVTEIIDQDYVYYVDSGSANTYAITPSPAIAAYEEGQRFVVRIANATSGASTLNVNGLGAIAIQTVDGSATTTGTLAAGGIYEFTYDANATPDRWVLTSPASEIPDGMLSGNVPLINAPNAFSADQSISKSGSAADHTIATTSAHPARQILTSNSSIRVITGAPGASSDIITGDAVGDYVVRVVSGRFLFSGDNGTTLHLVISASGAAAFSGAVSAPIVANSDSETLVAGQLHFIDANATLPNLTAGQWIQVINDSASPITISKNGSDTTYWAATGATVTTNFTLAARGVLTARCNPAGSSVYVSGSGITAAT